MPIFIQFSRCFGFRACFKEVKHAFSDNMLFWGGAFVCVLVGLG